MTRVPPMLCKPHRVPECPQCKKGTTMAGKCEHGLTTRECLVCASPKYGAEVRATSVDSLPTTAQMWDLLRRAYGPKLVGATLAAVIDNDGQCTVQTLTFPGPNGA